jgi:tetratricopeptide (TPR) repeat protein
VLTILREAETLAEALDDHRRLGRVCTYLLSYFWVMGDYDRALTSGQRALAFAEAVGDFAFQVLATAYLGGLYHTLGDYPRALDCLRRNIASLEGERLYERFDLPWLPAVFTRTYLVWCLAEMGAFAEGLAWGAEAARLAESVDHPFSRILAYCGTGYLYLCKGDIQQAIPVLERGLGLCQTVAIPLWSPGFATALGAAYARIGRISEALSLLEQAVAQSAAMQIVNLHALWLIHLGEGYRLAGRLEDAAQSAVRALELARAHQERGYQAYALRLLGEIAAHREPPEAAEAEAHFRQAFALAEELGMRPLVAHCHLGLSTLYLKTRRPKQARAELSAAIALYNAMDMTFWLPQAEAALARVEGR